MKKHYAIAIAIAIIMLFNGTSNNIPRMRMIAQGNGIYRFESPDGGFIRFKDMSPMSASILAAIDSISIDTIVINLPELDTTKFPGRLRYVCEIPPVNGYANTLLVGDVDRNGRLEMYGTTRGFYDPDYGPSGAYELDSDGVFRRHFMYPDSFKLATVIYDVDKDGMDEVGVTHYAQHRIFHKSSPTSFADSMLFECNPFAGEARWLLDLRFADVNRDGVIEFIAMEDTSPRKVYISAYNKQLIRLDTIYSFTPPNYHPGTAYVGDFDQDGKTDFIVGCANGEVYIVEHDKGNKFDLVWSGYAGVKNAYENMVTNDLDGNGKIELWVGGDMYYGGSGITRYTAFEADGDNSYKPVARIDFPTFFSFFAGNCLARDIDHDGKEELLMCMEENVVILKFTGSRGKFDFKVLVHKLNTYPNSNSVVQGATVADVDNDGKDELLFSLDEVANDRLRVFTEIYKISLPSSDVSIRQQKPTGYHLNQNYPNPFNPSTTIEFELCLRELANVTVYDRTGKEIRQLIDKELPTGSHRVTWDGRDNHGNAVASGVYFITLRTKQYSKTIKSLLIK